MNLVLRSIPANHRGHSRSNEADAPWDDQAHRPAARRSLDEEHRSSEESQYESQEHVANTLPREATAALGGEGGEEKDRNASRHRDYSLFCGIMSSPPKWKRMLFL